MLVQRAYKTELDLNNRQMTACRQHAGAARWAYNWGLRIKQERYKATKRSPTAIELHRELNGLKKTDVPWMYEVSKCAPQEALWNLDAAFQQFFRRCALKKQGKWTGTLGYPRLRPRRGDWAVSGSPAPSSCRRKRSCCRGWVGCGSKSASTFRPGVKILSATVSEQAGHWYVSLQVEEELAVPENTGPVVGIDLGMKQLATLSDGTVIPNPRHLKRRIKKLKRLQRVVSRRKKGSHNRKKAARKLATLHRQITNQRRNYAASGHDQAGENQVRPGD